MDGVNAKIFCDYCNTIIEYSTIHLSREEALKKNHWSYRVTSDGEHIYACDKDTCQIRFGQDRELETLESGEVTKDDFKVCRFCNRTIRMNPLLNNWNLTLSDSGWFEMPDPYGKIFYVCDHDDCRRQLIATYGPKYQIWPIDEEDDVHHPSHYMLKNGLEAKDVIEAAVKDVESAYHANIIKYALRYPHKGTPIKDLKKIKEYCDFIIELRGGEDGNC